MSADDGFGVVPSTLLGCASGIEAVAASVAQSKQAGDAVRVDGEAYGQLCRLVPIMVNSLQDIVLDAIGAADVSLRETAQRLRDVTSSYLEADSTSEEGIEQIEPDR